MTTTIITLVCWLVVLVCVVVNYKITVRLLDENSELRDRNGVLEVANQVNKQSIEFINQLLEEKEGDSKPESTNDHKEEIIRMKAEWKTLNEISYATGCSDSAISKAYSKRKKAWEC